MKQIVMLMLIYMRRLMTNKLFLVLMSFQCLYIYTLIHPLYRLSADYQVPLSSNLIIFFFRDSFSVMVLSAIMLVFLSALPFRDENQQYYVTRCSVKQWFWAQVGYIVCVVLLNMVCLLVMCCCFTRSVNFFDSEWGKVIGSLAYYPELASYYEIEIQVTNNVLTTYSPFQALLLWMMHYFSVMCSVGVGILCLNMIRSGVGSVLATSLIFLQYTLNFFGGYIGYYISPLSWIYPGNLSTSLYDYYPSVQGVMIAMWLVMVVLIGYVRVRITDKQYLESKEVLIWDH